MLTPVTLLVALSSISSSFQQTFDTRQDGQSGSDRWSVFWDNPSSISSIHPKIQVQSVLAEGIGWEGTGAAQETSTHVVIGVAGSENSLRVPYAFRQVHVKSEAPLACVVEQGQGSFSDCDMSADQVRTFKTNGLGRVSFSVPLDSQLKDCVGSECRLPALFIRTDYMPADEWCVLLFVVFYFILLFFVRHLQSY